MPLLNWYMQLWQSEDIQKLLGPSLWTLNAFIKNFTASDVALFYEQDDRGWWAATWVFPFMGGATWGLWVRADKRASGSRRAMHLIMDSLSWGLLRYPVLVNTTKQLPIVEKTARLGYTYLGRIPWLFEGEDCHVLYMTREMFEPILARWRSHNERR